MKVSACVIVKNEEKNLPRWLGCMNQLADEIVVVDTGSTDRTVELARAGRAKLFYFAWADDFAAAKNYALAQATGEWIIFLDADEYFLDEDCPAVRALLQREDVAADALLFELVNIDEDDHQRSLGSIKQWRIFRRRAGLRYVGAIHEVLCHEAGGEIKVQFVSGIKIYHTGYSSSLTRQKGERNLAILLRERRRRGSAAQDAFFLADCYYGLGDYALAEKFALEAIDSALQAQGMNNRPYAVWIQSLIKQERSGDEIESACQRAEMRYPSLPEFPLLRGDYLWRRKDYQGAAMHLARGVDLYTATRNQQQQDMSVGEQAESLLPTSLWRLGKMAAWRGNRETALDFFVQGLRLAPYEDTLLEEVAYLLKAVPTAEAVAFFNTIYDKRQDALYLARTLARAEMMETALYYDQYTGGTALTMEERFLLTGNVTNFAAAVSEVVISYCQLGVWAEAQLALPEGRGGLSLLLPTKFRGVEKGRA